MIKNLYLRSVLFGSIIPTLFVTAIFTAVFFTAQGWVPLIVLVLGIYALPISLLVSLLVALGLLSACKPWLQFIIGLLVCVICVIVTVSVLEYFN